jgi:hypothetical protein
MNYLVLKFRKKGEKMEYNKLREKYLDKLINAEDVLTETLKYSDIGLFKEDELQYLESLKKINQRFLNKLNAGEIEIAIIGMENSGKSSLANALVKLNEAFPTGSVRTTFTSTRLKYGKEDKAVVEFFSKSEFDQIFKEMLKKVKYPNLDVTFELLSLESYKDYFEKKLKNEDHLVYNAYYSTVNEDIKDILEGKEIILKYLNSENKIFSREDIENKKLKSFITDKYIARTVKKVEIFLSSLANMKELVLYDVPGFNSITEKHKIETREALKKADAIILIKNVAENPNITSEEQDILNSYDELGLPLSDKLFVFGTKVDRLDSKEEVEKNISTLKDEITNKFNVKEDRIFIGSPRAYLGIEEIIKEDVSYIVEKLEKLGIKNKLYEVDKLRDAIKNFYKNEAFNNIQKQINKNISNIKSVLSEVINRIDTSELENIQIENNEIFLNYIRKVDEKLDYILSNEKENIKEDIRNNQYFSKMLELKIDSLLDEITLKDLEEINKKLVDIRSEFATDKVNHEIRKILSKKAKNNFQQLIIDIASEKFNEILNKLNKSILEEVLLVNKENIYYDELSKELNNFINEKTKDIKYNETSFVYLIDRFSRDLISILIESGKGTPTRKNKFKEAKEEFLGLAFYYEKINSFNSIYDLSLIRKILNLPDYDIKKFILDNYNFFNLYPNQLEDILNIIVSKNIPLNQIKIILEKSFENFKEINPQNINIFKKKFFSLLDNINYELDLDEIFNEVSISSSKEELLDEINNDIETLKELLQKAVIKAIGLEIAFTTSVVKTIERLQEKNTMDDFIKKNFKKLKYDDLSIMEEKKANLEQQKRISDKIKDLLVKI